VRNFAKLTLLFSINFLIIFLAATGLRFLALQVDWAKNLPPKPETALTLVITAAYWALSFTLFSSVLFSLCYAGRRKYSYIMTVISVMSLSLLFCLGISVALENWKSVPPVQSNGIQLGNKGLILSNSLNRNETAVVLLNGAADPNGPRVTAIPGQPLLFNEAALGRFDLPPVPFGNDTPWFLKSLSIDIRLNAEMFQKKFDEGLNSWLIFAFSLIFLLCSFGYVIKMSVWPLANLFIGILAFRGILLLGSFISSPEMMDVMDSFLKGKIPVSLAIPCVFLAIGALLHLYSGLVLIVKGRNNDD
jgi:hypothetical protein